MKNEIMIPVVNIQLSIKIIYTFKMDKSHTWSVIFNKITFNDILKLRRSSSTMRNAETSIKEERLISNYHNETLIDYFNELQGYNGPDGEQVDPEEYDQELISAILLLEMYVDIPSTDPLWYDLADSFIGYKISTYALERGELDEEEKLNLLENFVYNYYTFLNDFQIIKYAENLDLDHEVIENRIVEEGDIRLMEILYPTFQFDSVNRERTDDLEMLAFYYAYKYEGKIIDGVISRIISHEINDDIFDFLIEDHYDRLPDDFGINLLGRHFPTKFMDYIYKDPSAAENVLKHWDVENVRLAFRMRYREYYIDKILSVEEEQEYKEEAEEFLDEYFPTN
jgi:hypothetical protein